MRTARSAAMDFLAQREHSQAELMRKLTAKGYTESEVSVAIEQLVADHLQSDARFTQHFIEGRMRRGYGPRYIAQALAQRGISTDLIEEYVWQTDVPWQETLSALYQKKYGDTKPATLQEKAKRSRFLMQRGFEPEHIKEVV